MTRGRGFTLLEIMVALVVTGLAAALAYAAAQAGFDTADRMARVREGAESGAVARSMLGNALRHALPGVRGTGNVFELSVAAGAARSDAIRFQTRGIVEPFGATDPWEVILSPSDSGLRLEARPLVPGTGSPIVATVRDVHGIDVRVRSSDARRGWLEAWGDPERSPSAVSVQFIGRDGRAMGAPLVSRVGLEVMP